jgi:Integrase zinc binding domain
VTEENWKEFGDMKDMMGEHGRFLVGEDDQMYQIFAETDIRVVSKTLRSAVLKLMHGRMVVGHWFFLRKAAILRKRFWWAGWYTAVEKQVADCLACRLSRIKRSRHQAKMQVWHPKARFETISVDVLELSPTSATSMESQEKRNIKLNPAPPSIAGKRHAYAPASSHRWARYSRFQAQ